jgi:succinate dehydrogenase / fumarate reductase, cytochrome b subunit
MGQTGSDAAVPTAAPKGLRTAAVRGAPLSPHVQVWRWHVTMAASIATRATGVALYFAALVLAGLVWALASGSEAYERYAGLLHSPLGLLVLFGIAASFFYHLAAGVRHLVWDTGRGFQPRTADTTALVAFACGFVGALALFAWAFAAGAI